MKTMSFIFLLALSALSAHAEETIVTVSQADADLARRQVITGGAFLLSGAAAMYMGDAKISAYDMNVRNLTRELPDRVVLSRTHDYIKVSEVKLTDAQLAELVKSYREIYFSAQKRPNYAPKPVLDFDGVRLVPPNSDGVQDLVIIDESKRVSMKNVHPDKLAATIRKAEAEGYFVRRLLAGPDVSLLQKAIPRGLGAITALSALGWGLNTYQRVQLPDGEAICGGSHAARCERTPFYKRALGAPEYQAASTAQPAANSNSAQ